MEQTTLSITLNSLSPKLSIGSQLKLTGTFKYPKKSNSPGLFNEYRYLKSLNIHYTFNASDFQIIKEPSLFWKTIELFRQKIIHIYTHTIEAHALPFILAISIGLRSDLPIEIKEIFSNTGMYHLLAISGLHIGILSMVWIILLKLIRVPMKIRFVTIGIFLWFFVFVTGESISVVRSVLLYSLFMLSVLIERKVSSLYILSLTALIILVFSPYQILSLGFHLTFIATFFLIYYSKIFSQLFRRLPKKLWIQNLALAISLSTLLLIITTPFLLPVVKKNHTHFYCC